MRFGSLMFQSSPTPGSRCNAWGKWAAEIETEVSILTDSWESVQRSLFLDAPAHIEVSILTDSWESVQHRNSSALSSPSAFQSSPTPGSRCNLCRHKPAMPTDDVSILTDSWESVQLLGVRVRVGTLEGFNPHRLLGVGATRRPSSLSSRSRGFNPHRLLGVGATHRHGSDRSACCRFNPHRLLGVGATEED